MDILQLLTGFFPIEPSERSQLGSDKRDQAICAILRSLPVTAQANDIRTALDHLLEGINDEGMCTEDVVRHILDKITPGLAAGQSGPRYFGFVTGGALPAAQVGPYPQFLQRIQEFDAFLAWEKMVHLPNDTISTALEYRTLEMVLDLLSVPKDLFQGRSLSTGATASNILGLTCGRDYVVRKVLNEAMYSIGDSGFPAGIRLRVVTDRHHASIGKAAAIVGIGRKNVVDLSATSVNSGISFSERLDAVISCYNDEDTKAGFKTGVIVVVGFAEVNTGDFTDMQGVREVCDKHSAWLHIDAAFGALACLLPEYSHISGQLRDADSITADAHKSFNTPYACGIFFTRSLKDLMSILAGSSTPAYLAPPPLSIQSAKNSAWLSSMPSPLHTNLENSRRFIALPLYCAILSMGKKGYAALMRRNVHFSRSLAEWMSGGEGGRWYECLNLRDMCQTNDRQGKTNRDAKMTVPLNVVLFRAKDVDDVPSVYRGSQVGMGSDEAKINKRRTFANAALIKEINATKRMYVSPGAYPGGAVRIAVSNWMTGLGDSEADMECVKDVLQGVMNGASTNE